MKPVTTLVVILVIACSLTACSKKKSTTVTPVPVMPKVDSVVPTIVTRDTSPVYPHTRELIGRYIDSVFRDDFFSNVYTSPFNMSITWPDSTHIIFRNSTDLFYYDDQNSPINPSFNDTFVYAGNTVYTGKLFTYSLADSVTVTWVLDYMPPCAKGGYHDKVVAGYTHK